MTTGAVTNTPTLLPAGSGTNNPLRDIDLEDFLKLMIAELRNQDPLNPMDNSQILQQIGQMQNIHSSNKLTDTLEAVALGQGLASATALIGTEIAGLADSGLDVVGMVDKVSVVNGVPKLHVGEDIVTITNVRAVHGLEFIFNPGNGGDNSTPPVDDTGGADNDAGGDGTTDPVEEDVAA